MIGISMRVFVKLAMLIFILGFIFLFVVYGYRFDNSTKSFVSQNVFVSMNFFSNDNTLVFNGNIYEPQQQQINFYNLEAGCYSTHFAGQEESKCYENNKLYTNSFVRYIDTKPYTRSAFSATCSPIEPVDHGKYSIGEQIFSQPIQSTFMFRKIDFLQVANTLYACNSDFSTCKELTHLEGDVVCGNKQ